MLMHLGYPIVISLYPCCAHFSLQACRCEVETGAGLLTGVPLSERAPGRARNGCRCKRTGASAMLCCDPKARRLECEHKSRCSSKRQCAGSSDDMLHCQTVWPFDRPSGRIVPGRRKARGPVSSHAAPSSRSLRALASCFRCVAQFARHLTSRYIMPELYAPVLQELASASDRRPRRPKETHRAGLRSGLVEVDEHLGVAQRAVT